MTRTTKHSDTRVVLASTTSPQHTGLLDELISAYLKWTALKGMQIDVVAVGTGAAIEIARRGDADILLVHDPERETAFVDEGYGVERRELMYNDFVILGPRGDPAGLKDARMAVDAFGMIAKSGAVFVSRGDESGTHSRERKLWQSAGVNVKNLSEYITAGQGMAPAIKTADKAGAYTLSDRGTYLAVKENLSNIALLFEGGPELYNQYSVMAVNPVKHPHVRYAEALDFIEFVTGPAGQGIIGGFKDKRGNVLFHPNAARKEAAAKKIA